MYPSTDVVMDAMTLPMAPPVASVASTDPGGARKSSHQPVYMHWSATFSEPDSSTGVTPHPRIPAARGVVRQSHDGQHGASVLDGHPVDTHGLARPPSPAAVFTGTLGMFQRAGFM